MIVSCGILRSLNKGAKIGGRILKLNAVERAHLSFIYGVPYERTDLGAKLRMYPKYLLNMNIAVCQSTGWVGYNNYFNLIPTTNLIFNNLLLVTNQVGSKAYI